VRIINEVLELSTDSGVDIHDLNHKIHNSIQEHGINNGLVVVTSRHTTTALSINEFEERLVTDIKTFIGELIPAGRHWLHNDIELRDCPPDEPENAHSHLAAMLLGSSEAIPVVNGELQLGTWQSVLFIELDGPRERSITLQLWGE
jgi:secondary thiamine-phosphate synthase enzyme